MTGLSKNVTHIRVYKKHREISISLNLNTSILTHK